MSAINRNIEVIMLQFPKTVSGYPAIFLNGRLLQLRSYVTNDDGVRELSSTNFVGLNLNSTRVEFVKLKPNFSIKKFTVDSAESMNRFVNSIWREVTLDSFTNKCNFSVNIEVLRSKLSANGIPDCKLEINPIIKTLNIYTGDYLLYKEKPADFFDIISIRDAEQISAKDKAKVAELYISRFKSFASADIVSYYMLKSMNKQTKVVTDKVTGKNIYQFVEYLSLKSGLTDIVPIAFKFPEVETQYTGDIGYATSLPSDIYDILVDDGKFNKAIGELASLSGDSSMEIDSYIELIRTFRNKVKDRIFDAPTVGTLDSTVKAMCATKYELYELTGIIFKNYRVGT